MCRYFANIRWKEQTKYAWTNYTIIAQLIVPYLHSKSIISSAIKSCRTHESYDMMTKVIYLPGKKMTSHLPMVNHWQQTKETTTEFHSKTADSTRPSDECYRSPVKSPFWETKSPRWNWTLVRNKTNLAHHHNHTKKGSHTTCLNMMPSQSHGES